MFLGSTSSRSLSSSWSRRQRLRSAMATARLASFWPTMIAVEFGNNFARGEVGHCLGLRDDVGSGFDSHIAIGVDADVGGDVERLAHDRLGIERRRPAARGRRPAHNCRRSRCRRRPPPAPARRRCRSAPATPACRRRSSWPRAGADSGRCASPWRAPPRRAAAGRDTARAWLSSRSNKVNASAVAPAKPPITSPLPSWRTFLALDLTMVWPIDTWPSPPMTTLPPLRTVRMVVPCQDGEFVG